MVAVRSSQLRTPYHAQRGALFLRGTTTPQRSWDLLEPGPSYLALSPTNLKKSRIVQGERTGAGALQEGGEADGSTETVGEAQGGRARTLNGASRLVGQPGQVVVPAESRADISAHGFWKRGTTAMFDIRIVNLDAVSYLRMTPEKALAKAEKENKELYPQACLERRRNFNPMVLSADGIPGAEALAAHKRLAALLSYKLKRE